MIDTIVLILPLDEIDIKDTNIFTPYTNANNILNNPLRGGFITASFTPTKKEYQRLGYLPRLTLMRQVKRPTLSGSSLKIEFSAPKLVFGNNFLELSEAQLPMVISSLQKQLEKIGVLVSRASLLKARVTTIHYSKNILLRDYSTPATYTKLLSKANVTKQLDLNRSDYRNEGHALRLHNNSFELIFYDKIKDLQKAKTSEKRAIESDNGIQLDLLDQLKQIKPFEVLRIEARLNTTRKIKHVLGMLDFNQCKLSLDTLFCSKISQAVLKHYFDVVYQSIPILALLDDNSPKVVFEKLMRENRKASIQHNLKLLGLHQLLSQIGVREFRDLIKHKSHAWYSLKKDLDELQLTPQTQPLALIENKLDQFALIQSMPKMSA